MQVLGFYRSTIGQKAIMAVTGLILVGFVVGHVMGNLLVFRGAQAMNDYAAFLKANAGVLWTVRLVLLGAVVLHVAAAVQLTRRAVAGRPVGYARTDPQAATIAARSMRWGGLALAVFVVLHLLHFTTGTIHPRFDHADVYGNVVTAFRVWWIAALYVLAMVALGMHLYHGTWSMLQTLGVSHPGINPARRRLSTSLAVAVLLGFIVIPVAVLAGLVR